jgi:methionyl-tRNA synthetase
MLALSLSEFAQQQGIPLWLLVFVIFWSLVWKGIAWWKSARLGQPVWFVAFFIVNTFGILEILYIFLFSRTEFLTAFRNSVPRSAPKVPKTQLPRFPQREAKQSVLFRRRSRKR